MNNLRAKQIFENIKKDGILSEQELEAIQYLIDKRQAINCRQCSFYVPNIDDSSEFFCSLHKSYLRSNPDENSCTWAELKESLSRLNDSTLEFLKDTLMKPPGSYDIYPEFWEANL